MIFERTLPNGMELIVYPTTSPVASVFVWVDVGSIDEKPAEAGWCHFLEHMLFKGTKKRSTAQIAGAVEGAGGEMNAFTSFEYTAYHITLSNLQWKLANSILADMVLGSVFKPKEFNPEKEVILEEIKRGDDSPDRRLYQGLYKNIWGDRHYGRPVIGYPKTVKACTAQKLKAFWKKWYNPALMTLVVCGNVDPAAVEAEVLKTWGKAKGKAIRSRRRHLVDRSGFATQPKLKDTLAFPVNSVRWAAALPAVSLKDDKLALLDLATTILGAGASSRLHQRLYRKENVVTSVSCSVWAPYAQGLLSFDVEAPPEKAALFMKPLWQEVDRFAEEGPTEEELTKAKNQLESERIYAMQNMEGMAYRLGYMKLSSGDVKFDLNYLNQVREASADDVKDAFKGLLQGKLQEYVLVPNGFDSSVVWSQYDRGRPVEAKKQSVAQERRDQKIKHQSPLLPRLVSLPNGIDLLLIQRNDVPVVSINAAILGGTRYETPQTSGLGYLLSNVWDKAPRGWTAEHTAHFLESRASRISAFSGRNSMGLSASTLTKYLADILPVYVDTLFAPALDEEEFSREKTVLLEDIKTYDDQPTRLIDRLFCESLFEGHPYSWPVIGREKTIKDADHSSIKNHFTRSIAQRVVVAVSGKFQENKLIQAFEKIQRNVVVDQKPSAKAKFPVAQRFVEVAKNREQSHIIHGYPGLTVCEKDRHQLRVLLTVLGGQSGRLFTELRDKQGLCYVVSPYSMEGLDPGYVAVYMGCDPKKRTVALEGIQRELDRLAKRSVSTGELQRAKEFLLGRHHMDMQMNSTLASVVSLNTLYGLGHDAHLTLENEMKSVSARSISDFAKKLLDRPAVTAIVV